MFNIFSTIKDNASQAFGTAKSAVGGAINTANQNLQEFGGDVYETYSSAKNTLKNTYDSGYNKLYNAGGNAYDTYANTRNIVTNKVQKANQKLQDFGGDVYDYGIGQKNEIAGAYNTAKSLPGKAYQSLYDFGGDTYDYLTDNGNMSLGQVAQEMSRNTGDLDQEKLNKVLSDLSSKGLGEEEIGKAISSVMERNPGFFRKKTFGDKVRSGTVDVARNVWNSYDRYNSGEQTMGETALQGVGNTFSLFGNAAGSAITSIPGVESALGAVGGAVAKIPGVATGVQAYQNFAENNPRAAANIGSIANIGTTALGWNSSGKAIEAAPSIASKTVSTAKQIGNKSAPVVTSTIDKVGNVATAPLKSTISAIKRYAGSPEEIAGTQYAIGAKSVLRNGRNLRPQKQITEEIGIANGLIRSAGKKPTDIASYREAIKDEMEKIGGEISRLTNQDLTIDMSPIANKLRQKAMSDTIQTLDEEGARKLLALADKYDRKIPIREAEDMNQFINAMLRNKDITVNESVKQGLQDIVVGIRSGLDSSISQIPGQFRDLKKAYGSLRNVYGDVTAKEIVINRKALSGLYESFSTIEGFGDIVGGLGKIVTGSPGAGFSDIAKGFTKNKVGEFITRKNDPNEVIKKVFSKSGKSRAMPDIQKKQIKLLPAPKANAKQSEILAPIKGSKSAEELSRESTRELSRAKIDTTDTKKSIIPNRQVLPKKLFTPLKSEVLKEKLVKSKTSSLPTS